MAREIRQPFNPSCAYIARKEFTFNGVEFLPGAPFDPEENDCSDDKMRKLFEARCIMPGEKKAKEKKPKATVAKKKGGKKAA